MRVNTINSVAEEDAPVRLPTVTNEEKIACNVRESWLRHKQLM